MAKQILHIENTNNEDFKNEILIGVSDLLKKFESSLNDDDKLLTREETAEMLSISLVTLWKYTKKDIITAFRIGSNVRYKKSDILLALEKMNGFEDA